VFVDYRLRRADNTLRRQDADLALFAEYLRVVGLPVEASALALRGKLAGSHLQSRRRLPALAAPTGLRHWLD
jgi:hypothetical protein